MKKNIDFKNDLSTVNKEKIFERIPLKSLDLEEKLMTYIFFLFLWSSFLAVIDVIDVISFRIFNNISYLVLSNEHIIIFNFVFSLIISAWSSILIVDLIKAFSIKRLINRAMVLSLSIFFVIACFLVAELGLFVGEEVFKSIKPI